jgi:hypothetical protein
MPRKLYVYDKTDYLDRWQSSGRFSRRDDDVRILPVSSVQDLLDGLDRFLSAGLVFDRMLVQTHGNSGRILFGNQNVWDITWRDEFGNRGYDRLFPTFARIYFDGCNVAKGGDGVEFLRAAGRVFLKGMGGEVVGWTSFGLGLPGWIPFIGGHTIHPAGYIVRVRFAPGDLDGQLNPDDYTIEMPYYPGT